MPDTLWSVFQQVNRVIDNAKSQAELRASQFTTDRPRSEVIDTLAWARGISNAILNAKDFPGMEAYARDQWGEQALGWIAKAQAIEDAADAVADYVEANFPTVGVVLDNAMAALSVPSGQQDALRAEMGGNLDYLLSQKIESSAVVSPTIPAGQLAPLVTLLTALATAATIAS